MMLETVVGPHASLDGMEIVLKPLNVSTLALPDVMALLAVALNLMSVANVVVMEAAAVKEALNFSIILLMASATRKELTTLNSAVLMAATVVNLLVKMVGMEIACTPTSIVRILLLQAVMVKLVVVLNLIAVVFVVVTTPHVMLVPSTTLSLIGKEVNMIPLTAILGWLTLTLRPLPTLRPPLPILWTAAAI